MDELLQTPEVLYEGIWRWRHEYRITWSGPADPVLACSKLSWHLMPSATAGEENFMNFAEKPQGDGKPTSQTLEPVVHCRNVARDLGDVLWHAIGNARPSRLIQQQIRKASLLRDAFMASIPIKT